MESKTDADVIAELRASLARQENVIVKLTGRLEAYHEALALAVSMLRSGEGITPKAQRTFDYALGREQTDHRRTT